MTLVWSAPSSDLNGQAAFRVESAHEYSIIIAGGEIDLLTAPAFREAVNTAGEVSDRIAIDLSAVDFMDSTGIGVLISALGRPRRRTVSLIAPPPIVRKVLQLTQLDHHFLVFDSLEHALQHGAGTPHSPA
jgi:anti-sigma B factor antagonist